MRTIVIALAALLGSLYLARGPDGGLRPPPGDYRVPQPVPPRPPPRPPGPAAGKQQPGQSDPQQGKKQQNKKPRKHTGKPAPGSTFT